MSRNKIHNEEFYIEFGKRLKKIREILNLSIEEFADKLGILETSYYSYENGTRFPKKNILKNIINILFKMNINLNWLFIGEGNIFLKNESSDESSFSTVPEISPATCGASGIIPEDMILGYKAFEKKFLKKFKDPVVTRAMGDSMEPLIRDKDLILIDRDPEYRLHPKNNSIYLINNPDTDEELAFTIKRILLAKTTLFLIPQNPAYGIQQVDLYKKNILKILLGRVVWYGRELE